MRDLFEQLVIDGEAGIDRLVAERRQESLMVEFKRKADDRVGTLDEGERRTLAKALSALSNSAGGVLIYGVKGVRGDDGIDCAQEAKPIANIERFLSEVTTHSGELLQPRHDGIEVQAIRSDRLQGSGYVVLYVPRSERRPHRSEAKGQKSYFKRAGDKTYEMEHYDIEDAFKRISSPELMLYLRRYPGPLEPALSVNMVQVIVRNESYQTAENVYCHLLIYNACILPPDLTKYQLDDGFDMTAGLYPYDLHPQLTLNLRPMSVQYRTAPPNASEPSAIRVHVECRFGCKDMRPKRALYTAMLSDIPLGDSPFTLV